MHLHNDVFIMTVSTSIWLQSLDQIPNLRGWRVLPAYPIALIMFDMLQDTPDYKRSLRLLSERYKMTKKQKITLSIRASYSWISIQNYISAINVLPIYIFLIILDIKESKLVLSFKLFTIINNIYFTTLSLRYGILYQIEN